MVAFVRMWNDLLQTFSHEIGQNIAMVSHLHKIGLCQILLICFGTLTDTFIISSEDCFGICVFENPVEDIGNVFNPGETISWLIYRVNSRDLFNQKPGENSFKIFARFPKRLRSKCLAVFIEAINVPQIVSIIQHTGLAIVKHALYFVNVDRIRGKEKKLAKPLIDQIIASGVHPNVVMYSFQKHTAGILCYLCENDVEVQPKDYDVELLTELSYKQNGNLDGLSVLGECDWAYLNKDCIKPDRDKEYFYQRMIHCNYPRDAVWGTLLHHANASVVTTSSNKLYDSWIGKISIGEYTYMLSEDEETFFSVPVIHKLAYAVSAKILSCTNAYSTATFDFETIIIVDKTIWIAVAVILLVYYVAFRKGILQTVNLAWRVLGISGSEVKFTRNYTVLYLFGINIVSLACLSDLKTETIKLGTIPDTMTAQMVEGYRLLTPKFGGQLEGETYRVLKSYLLGKSSKRIFSDIKKAAGKSSVFDLLYHNQKWINNYSQHVEFMKIMGKNQLTFYLPMDGQEYTNALGSSTIYVSKEYQCKMSDIAYEANINPQAAFRLGGLWKWHGAEIANKFTESGLGIRNANLKKTYDQRLFMREPGIIYAKNYLYPKPFGLRSIIGVAIGMMTGLQIMLIAVFASPKIYELVTIKCITNVVIGLYQKCRLIPFLCTNMYKRVTLKCISNFVKGLYHCLRTLIMHLTKLRVSFQ